MGSQPALRCTSQVTGAAPRPDAVPLRSAAFPGDAGFPSSGMDSIQRQRVAEDETPEARGRAESGLPALPAPSGGRQPRAGAAGAPSGKAAAPRGAAAPPDRRSPGRAGLLQAPSGEAAPCERLPGAPPGVGDPRAPRHPPSSPRREAPKRCKDADTDGAVLKFISSSVLEAKAASLSRFGLSR